MTSDKDKTFNDLQTQEEFRVIDVDDQMDLMTHYMIQLPLQQYASALGEQIVARQGDDLYLFFVNTLVEEICAPSGELFTRRFGQGT